LIAIVAPELVLENEGLAGDLMRPKKRHLKDVRRQFSSIMIVLSLSLITAPAGAVKNLGAHGVRNKTEGITGVQNTGMGGAWGCMQGL